MRAYVDAAYYSEDRGGVLYNISEEKAWEKSLPPSPLAKRLEEPFDIFNNDDNFSERKYWYYDVETLEDVVNFLCSVEHPVIFYKKQDIIILYIYNGYIE